MNDLTRGGVVLKYFETGVPWLYTVLKPFEHYVPVRPDLSDLIERIEWLRANDAKAQKIAEAGRTVVMDVSHQPTNPRTHERTNARTH